MQSHHWLMFVAVLVAGYVLGRYWSAPAQLVGIA